jgi:F-type H+-transporting ATPase subunit gamma
MPNLRDIRDRISSVQSTQQITKAMKMVAAAKLRKAQNRIIDLRPYAHKLKGVLNTVVSNAVVEHPYFKAVDNVQKVLYIVVSSDRGLCGGFNTNLFKVVESDIREKFPQHSSTVKVSILALGRKSNDYFRKRGYTMTESKAGFMDKLVFDHATTTMNSVRKSFELGEYDLVYLVYNEFKSIIAQNRVMEQLLPIPAAEHTDTQTDYLFEPKSDELLLHLLPLYLNNQLWKALLESFASEQGARMAAMDNATENAKEIVRQLRLTYNQARQAAITTEISEIVSGAEALSQ